MDIVGTAASFPPGTDGSADDGAAEYVFRFAPLVGIYGGTLEVFRNMIAQFALGLGKTAYAPAKPEKQASAGVGTRHADDRPALRARS